VLDKKLTEIQRETFSPARRFQRGFAPPEHDILHQAGEGGGEHRKEAGREPVGGVDQPAAWVSTTMNKAKAAKV